MARLRTQPLAILVCGVLRHANGRESFLAHAKTHFHVRRSRHAHRIHDGIIRLWRFLCAIFVTIHGSDHERTILIPSDLVLAHPERLHFHFHLWSFIRTAVLFTGRTSQGQFTTLDRHHVIIRARDLDHIAIGCHAPLISHFSRLYDMRPNLLDKR